jgi:transposase
MDRGDLSDAEWDLIGSPLPPERGRWGRPSGDNRLFLNGMLHVLRIGCPWRDMHERYGKWNSVYVRFRRWAEQGVWDALLQTLVDLGLTDDWQHMIDSTTVRGHVSAAGGKGGLCAGFWSITRRLYEQGPRPLRQSGPSCRLYPDRRRGIGLYRRRSPDDPAVAQAQGAAGRQGVTTRK